MYVYKRYIFWQIKHTHTHTYTHTHTHTHTHIYIYIYIYIYISPNQLDILMMPWVDFVLHQLLSNCLLLQLAYVCLFLFLFCFVYAWSDAVECVDE